MRLAGLLLLGVLTLWPGQMRAADWQVQLLEAGNLYRQSPVWSGHFTAANGQLYDASHLYQNRRRPLYLRGEIQLYGLARVSRAGRPINLILPFAYDNGFDSAKFTARPRFTMGAALQGRQDQLVWQIRLDGLLDTGGQIRERACYDATGRDFHCGTGLAWRDSSGQHIPRTNRRAASLHLVWLW